MKTEFIVAIEGSWKDGNKRVTAAGVQKELRKAIRDGFEFLAKRTSVKRHASPKPDNIYEIASRRAMTLDSLEQILRTAKKEPDAAWLIEQMEKTLEWHKGRMAELPGVNPTL